MLMYLSPGNWLMILLALLISGYLKLASAKNHFFSVTQAQASVSSFFSTASK
jgi:hypothetical protein